MTTVSPWRLVQAAGLLLASSAAFGQSAVTLYGIVDAGVTRVSNVAGRSQVLVDTGVMQASRLGYRGREDLGGGRAAIFTLEQGFVLDTGVLGQGGLVFGRQAWVGLQDDRLGTVTLGRQYDFMFDSLVAHINSTHDGGGYANNPLDNDRMSGQRVNNAVKYMTPTVGGFAAGAMFAPSEASGSVRGAGYSRSFGLSYKRGTWSVGAAYTYLDAATLEVKPITGGTASRVVGGVSNRLVGFGATYQPSAQWALHAVVNESRFDGTTALASGRFRNYQAGAVYRFSEQWRLAVSGDVTKFDDNRYRQINLSADHLFSKRTDGYVQAIFQRASGASATAAIFLLPNASGPDQNALRIGLRHRF